MTDWDDAEDALIEVEKAVERLRATVREGQRQSRRRVPTAKSRVTDTRAFETVLDGGQITP